MGSNVISLSQLADMIVVAVFCIACCMAFFYLVGMAAYIVFDWIDELRKNKKARKESSGR